MVVHSAGQWVDHWADQMVDQKAVLKADQRVEHWAVQTADQLAVLKVVHWVDPKVGGWVGQRVDQKVA